MSAFLNSGGECAGLIAKRDWSDTLGPVDRWPQSLKAATALILRSPVPMVMLWGIDGIMIYNDGYAVVAGGRHPTLLGSKVLEWWPEAVEFNAHVMDVGLAGGTLQYRDQELTLHRHGGPEQVWLNLDYSPVIGDDGQPAGVLAIVIETTERVRAEAANRRRQDRLAFFDRLTENTGPLSSSKEIMAVTARLLGEQIGASLCAYADVEPDQDSFTIRGDWAAAGTASIVGNYTLESFGATASSALRGGKPFVSHDLIAEFGAEEVAQFTAIGIAATVVLPLVKQARLIALMAVHSGTPRHWSGEDLSLVAETIARSWAYVERVRSEAALRESESALRNVVEQMPLGVAIATVPQGELLIYNRQSTELLGLDPSPGQDVRDYGIYKAVDEDGAPVPIRRYPLARAVMAGEIVHNEEMRYRRDDGEIVYLEVNAARIVTETGEADLAVTTFSDISERKRAERHQRLLIDELSHRAKNLLAIIQSVAQQSFKSGRDPQAMVAAFEGRLGALAAAHSILTRERWEAAPLRTILCDTITSVKSDDHRLKLDGPDVMVNPKTSVSLAMAVHELATNALKYGSLSHEEGTLTVRWSVADGRLNLQWIERGGPPVTPPDKRGFGSRMIERGLAAELGGTVKIDFQPEGVVCTVDAPLPAV